MTHAPQPERPTLPPGLHVMGEYVIERPLVRGPLWVTYAGWHADRAREPSRFRIRVLRTNASARLELIEAFARQAQLLESLHHPGLVPIVATGVDQGVPLIISREVAGTSLETLLASAASGLPLTECARIVRQIATVLAYLHERDRPVVHRELAPATVLLAAPDQSVRLLDVGHNHALRLAGVDVEALQVATAGAYVAPEGTRQGAKVGPTADQFVLASIAFECLTGRRAFGADGADATAAIESGSRPSAARARTGVPPGLDAVLHRAWALSPQDRYPSIGEFADAFGDALIASPASGATAATSTGTVMTPAVRGIPEAAPLSAPSAKMPSPSGPLATAGTAADAARPAARSETLPPTRGVTAEPIAPAAASATKHPTAAVARSSSATTEATVDPPPSRSVHSAASSTPRPSPPVVPAPRTALGPAIAAKGPSVSSERATLVGLAPAPRPARSFGTGSATATARPNPDVSVHSPLAATEERSRTGPVDPAAVPSAPRAPSPTVPAVAPAPSFQAPGCSPLEAPIAGTAGEPAAGSPTLLSTPAWTAPSAALQVPTPIMPVTLPPDPPQLLPADSGDFTGLSLEARGEHSEPSLQYADLTPSAPQLSLLEEEAEGLLARAAHPLAATTQPPPAREPVAAARPSRSGLIAAAILIGSVGTAAAIYRLGVPPDGSSAASRAAGSVGTRAVQPSPPVVAPAATRQTPSSGTVRTAPHQTARPEGTPTDLAPTAAAHGSAASAAASTPGADAAAAAATPLQLDAPSPVPPRPERMLLPERPSFRQLVPVRQRIEQRIQQCARAFGRENRHARFMVTYSGPTGQMSNMRWFGTYFANRPIGRCIEDAVQNNPVPVFGSPQWTTDFVFMVH